jgi:sialidase-1
MDNYNLKTANETKDNFLWSSHFIYSDDHGETWHLGHVFENKTNEFLAVELNNGSILSVLRRNNNNEGVKSVYVSSSNDGGQSSSPLQFLKILQSPICQSSIIRMNSTIESQSDLLIFSGPYHQSKRINFTLLTSNDNGKTWLKAVVISKQNAGYSDLAIIGNNTLAGVFEGGRKDYREKITFFTIDRIKLI